MPQPRELDRLGDHLGQSGAAARRAAAIFAMMAQEKATPAARDELAMIVTALAGCLGRISKQPGRRVHRLGSAGFVNEMKRCNAITDRCLAALTHFAAGRPDQAHAAIDVAARLSVPLAGSYGAAAPDE